MKTTKARKRSKLCGGQTFLCLEAFLMDIYSWEIPQQKRKGREKEGRRGKEEEGSRGSQDSKSQKLSSSQNSSEQDSPIRNSSVRENRVGMGTARKAWADFSIMHQELEEMSRQNTEMLDLHVLQAKSKLQDLDQLKVQIFKVRFLEASQISLVYLKQL